MNADNQRIAIATACGWTHILRDPLYLRGKKPGDDFGLEVVPHYLSRLDACSEFERILDQDELLAHEYANLIFAENAGNDFLSIIASPEARCRCFLKTIGKWESQ